MLLVLDPKNKVHIDTEVIAWSSQRRDMYHAFADVSQLLLLVHTPVARSFFTYFDCISVSGKSYLKEDMSLRCDSDDYYLFMIFILFVGVLYVVGFPLAIAVYLYHHRNELYAVRVTDKIGFLYDRFQKGSEFWELHELIRKVMLTGVAVTLAHNPTLQVLMAAFVCVLAQVNLNYFKPHKNKIVYCIAQTCFGAITVKYLVALLLMGNDAAKKDAVLGVFLIGIDIASSALGVLGLLLSFYVLGLKIKKIKQQHALDLRNENNDQTKVVPIDEALEDKLMMAQRDALLVLVEEDFHEVITTSMEKKMRGNLMDLVDLDKKMFLILMKREKHIEDLHAKLRSLEQQMESSSKSSSSSSSSSSSAGGSTSTTMEHQLIHLKEQLRIAQQSANGLSASGVGQRATTLITLLRCLFRTFDPNATGHLGQPQLRDLFLHVMGATSANRRTAEADAMTVINSVDTDGNGTVEEQEFIDWIQKGIGQDVDKRMKWGQQSLVQQRLLDFLTAVVAYCQTGYLKSIFIEFDRDLDGALTKTELVALMVEMKMRSVSQSDLSTSLKSIAADAGIVLSALDADGNGTVELEELTDWLTEGLSRPLEDRKQYAMQGGVYKRLEMFLKSVEETANKRYVTRCFD